MSVPSLFYWSTGAICFSTAVTHLPNIFNSFYRFICYKKTTEITKVNDPHGFAIICKHINTALADDKFHKFNKTTYDCNISGKNYNGEDCVFKERFHLLKPGSIIPLADHEIDIEVIGSEIEVFGFLIHQRRAWTWSWNSDETIIQKYATEYFLISLGTNIGDIYVPLTEFLLNVYNKLPEDKKPRMEIIEHPQNAPAAPAAAPAANQEVEEKKIPNDRVPVENLAQEEKKLPNDRHAPVEILPQEEKKFTPNNQSVPLDVLHSEPSEDDFQEVHETDNLITRRHISQKNNSSSD